MLSLSLLFSGCSGSDSPSIDSYNSKLIVQIDQPNWSRLIQVEKQVDVTHSDWSVPNDAKIISQTSKIKRYDSYVCGYTKINKVSVPQYCQNPVYAQYYTYTVKEWQVTRTVSTSGGARDEIVWGDLTLSDGEREGRRIETFGFSTKVGKDPVQCSVENKTDWESLNVEMSVLVLYNSKTKNCKFLNIPSPKDTVSPNSTPKA